MRRPTIRLAKVGGELDVIGDPSNDEALQWIDALALAVAAGVRVGQRGMLGPPEGAIERTETTLTPGHDPEVMDADEVAAFLGVDRTTGYDYAWRGEIPHRRLGKRLLFSRRTLVSWLGSCKAASARKG